MNKRTSLSQGFTLIEAILYVAITSIIGLVVSNFFLQTHKLSHRSLNNQDIFSREIILKSWFQKDLNSSSRNSVGSLLLNGGFEIPNNADYPLYWDSELTLGTTAVAWFTHKYVTNSLPEDIRSGLASLQLTCGFPSFTGPTEYGQNYYMKIEPGMALMVSGWVKAEDISMSVGLKLIDNDDPAVLIGSTMAYTTEWQRLQFRYPSSGFYPDGGSLPDDELQLRLVMAKLGPLAAVRAWFDDVSVTPIHAVLTSETEDVNINNTPTDMSDGAESVGFPFTRWDEENLEFYRYRVEGSGLDSYLVRERYNRDNSLWENTFLKKWSEGLSDLSISYDSGSVLPPEGKNKVVTVAFRLKNKYMERQNIEGHLSTLEFYPSTP